MRQLLPFSSVCVWEIWRAEWLYTLPKAIWSSKSRIFNWLQVCLTSINMNLPIIYVSYVFSRKSRLKVILSTTKKVLIQCICPTIKRLNVIQYSEDQFTLKSWNMSLTQIRVYNLNERSIWYHLFWEAMKPKTKISKIEWPKLFCLVPA